MTDLELGWIVGLLEGEGCFGIYKDKRRPTTSTVKIQMESTDKDIVDRLNLLVPGRVWESNYPAKYRAFPNAKESWRWQISDRKRVMLLIVQIYPYMSDRRKLKLDEIVDYYNTRKVLDA